MADITQSYSNLLRTYGPGAMLDMPEHAVVVSGLQGWRYIGSDWQPIAEERLVALLKQQLGDKLSKDFSGIRPPPAYDEDRHDQGAPGIEVLIFPTWFTVDDVAPHDGDEMAHTEKRRRIAEFHELSVSSAGKLSYNGDGKKVGVNPIRFV